MSSLSRWPTCSTADHPQASNRLRKWPKSNGPGLGVFTNRTGGPLQARDVIRAFHGVLGSCNLRRIRFHDLRHSCATLLKVQEVPDQVVTEVLGHSDLSMTLDYMHAIPELQRKAAERMESLISSNGPQTVAERER
jgi:integrase